MHALRQAARNRRNRNTAGTAQDRMPPMNRGGAYGCTGSLFRAQFIGSSMEIKGITAGYLPGKWRNTAGFKSEGGELKRSFPIPLHPARKRKRGYNQAEILAEELGLPSSYTG